MQVCPSCREENPPKFRLCGYCGTPLVQSAQAPEVRKTVTIVFSDLKGSTSLGELVDPEALHEIKNRYFAAMAAVLGRHGGKIEKYIGDAIMAVFGLPRVREDDALRAVRAALGMQQELARINVDLERTYGISLAARMGVNTGEVVATADPSADQRLADGDAVNVAARLEQASGAMEVLIGDMTYQLVRDHVEVEPVEPLTLKGKAERVPAFRLLNVRAAGSRAARPREAPLIGRDAEIELMGAELAASVASRRARLVTLIGDPGVGKSRLISEFADSIRDRAQVVHGRCLPYGDGITFWPIAEVVREAAQIAEEDSPDAARSKVAELVAASEDRDAIVERVSSAIGLSPSIYPVSELFWGVRKLLEALAVDQPLVVVIDDLQAAEPTLLELLDHLVLSADAPILLVCSARHELLDQPADWGAASRRIVLRALSAADTEAMIEQFLGQSGIEPRLLRRVAVAAEGNPLFVEQMVSVLIDHGSLRLDDGRWVVSGDLSRLVIPPTIHALVAARLDYLGREERAVIAPASVIGLVFPQAAIEELVTDGIRPTVSAQLGVLDRKQFVHPSADEDESFRFHHQLIREAAYGSLLKRSRAQLHESFVTWAERVNRERDRDVEFEEILGYHLEQAFRYRQDLGPVDDEARQIALRGARKLGSAGRRASARGDMPAAAHLLARAVALLPDEDELRRELMPELAEALIEEGNFDRAAEVLLDGTTVARKTGDERLSARLALEQLALDLYRSESTRGDEATETTRRAIEVFDRAGDQPGLARAWRLTMLTHGTVGRFEDATRAAERFVDYATRAGDLRLAARGASGYATAALLGPNPVSEVIARCEALIVEVGDDRKAVGVISGVLAVLHAMEGSFERARELYANARRTLEELGPSVTAASTSTEASRVEMLAGDFAAAERELRRDLQALEGMGEKYFRSTVAGYLARVLFEQGRLDEAATWTTTTRSLAAADDTASQVLWRAVDARLAALAGDAARAVELGEEARRLVSETPSPSLIADATSDLAEIYMLLGEPAVAAPLWREARELYERKGDRVSAARLADRLARIDEVIAPSAVSSP